MMAGTRLRRSRALPGETTTTVFGSIRQIRSASCGASIKARQSASTVASPGVLGTTSRRENFIESRRITGFPIGCTGRSRIAAQRELPAAETTDKLRSETGFRWDQEKAATRFRIRWIRTLFTTRGRLEV